MPVDQASAAPAAIQMAADTKRTGSSRSLRSGLAVGLGLAALASVAALYVFMPWSSLLTWAAQEQRTFQNAMAGSLRAIRSGDNLAILTLCGATAAYGFVHALGPGHGKVLLGGASLASGATMRRMALLTLISSLGQAASAIGLVVVAALLLGWATRDLVGWTEAWLAPASAIGIAAIGVLLIIRGLRSWPVHQAKHRHAKQHHHAHHTEACGCGHAHGPTASEIQSLTSTRDAVALVASIAIRPCTGALFLLIIALRMDIFAAGCLAVVTMSLGTAAFNLLVAASGVMTRRLAALPIDGHAMKRFSAGLHIAGGTVIALVSSRLAWTYLDSPFGLP